MLEAAKAYAENPTGASDIDPPFTLAEALEWCHVIWSDFNARASIVSNEWVHDGVGVKTVSASLNFADRELNRPAPLREFFCDVRRRQRTLRIRSDISAKHSRNSGEKRGGGGVGGGKFQAAGNSSTGGVPEFGQGKAFSASLAGSGTNVDWGR